MSKRWKPKLENRSYRGVRLVPPTHGKPDERGLFDLRPMRFQSLRGASAIEILMELVNLPDDAKAPEVRQFIAKFHNLALGGTSSEGKKSQPMTPEEVIRLRGLYRQFWEVRNNSFRSMLFSRLIGPWREAGKSPVPDDELPTHTGDLFPLLDYNESALQMDWKTGRFKIVARGPLDWLTHAVFQNRNRVRVCDNCNRLFIGYGPNESLCSAACKLDNERVRKRKWWRKNRAVLTP